jgi:hypothetical protein
MTTAAAVVDDGAAAVDGRSSSKRRSALDAYTAVASQPALDHESSDAGAFEAARAAATGFDGSSYVLSGAPPDWIEGFDKATSTMLILCFVFDRSWIEPTSSSWSSDERDTHERR